MRSGRRVESVRDDPLHDASYRPPIDPWGKLTFADDPRTVAFPALGEGRVVLSTELNRDDAVSLAQLRLRPPEECVIELP